MNPMKQMNDNLDPGRKMLPEPMPQALKRGSDPHELAEAGRQGTFTVAGTSALTDAAQMPARARTSSFPTPVKKGTAGTVSFVVTTETTGLDRYSQEIGKRLRVRRLESRRYLSLKQTYQFIRMARNSGGMLHLPNQHFARYAPLFKQPFVVTVHDVVRLCFGFSGETLLERALLKLDILGIKRAHHIIAVSQCTKNDLIRFLGIPEPKITVVYNGIDDSIFRPCADGLLQSPCLLYVGSERPRKNLISLLRAFSELKRQFPGLKLVKVGTAGRADAYRRSTISQAESLGLSQDIVFTDHVPDSKLPLYYSSASVLVYPSLYEGFGLPPLEAMACGCPVVTSNTSSLPEVVGDAGIMVDPLDVDGMAEAVSRVLRDGHLRQQMVAKGLAQAGRFSWHQAAEETWQVYQKLGAV